MMMMMMMKLRLKLLNVMLQSVEWLILNQMFELSWTTMSLSLVDLSLSKGKLKACTCKLTAPSRKPVGVDPICRQIHMCDSIEFFLPDRIHWCWQKQIEFR